MKDIIVALIGTAGVVIAGWLTYRAAVDSARIKAQDGGQTPSVKDRQFTVYVCLVVLLVIAAASIGIVIGRSSVEIGAGNTQIDSGDTSDGGERGDTSDGGESADTSDGGESADHADTTDGDSAKTTEDGKDAQYYYEIGVRQFRQEGDYNAAAESFQMSVDLDPDNFNTQHWLGFTLNRLGRYEEALPHLQKAVDMKPGDNSAHNNLGIALSGLNRDSEALLQYGIAVALNDNASVRHNLGHCLERLECYQEAVEQFEKAVELDPDNSKYQADLETAKNKLAEQQAADTTQ